MNAGSPKVCPEKKSRKKIKKTKIERLKMLAFCCTVTQNDVAMLRLDGDGVPAQDGER